MVWQGVSAYHSAPAFLYMIRAGLCELSGIDEQKARGLVARPKHGRHGTAQARHGPEDTGPGLGTARVPGRAWAARQARRVARHGPQLVEGMVEAR